MSPPAFSMGICTHKSQKKRKKVQAYACFSVQHGHMHASDTEKLHRHTRVTPGVHHGHPNAADIQLIPQALIMYHHQRSAWASARIRHRMNFACRYQVYDRLLFGSSCPDGREFRYLSLLYVSCLSIIVMTIMIITSCLLVILER